MPNSISNSSRLHSIDALRGLVILFMLLDHVRETFYLHMQVSDPMDVSQTDPALFFSVRIECEAEPGTSGFFVPEVGDYLAVMDAGKIQMYFLHDWREDEHGCTCVLIRDDIQL